MRSFANGHFFQLLGTLLFRHEQLNILHMLIKKSFTHIFTNDRPIYHEYRRHLFQEADLLEMLAGRPVLLASE